MTDLRTAAQQALAFTMRDFARLRDFEAAKAALHDNLRAALAQQDEPVQEPVQEPEGLDWRYTARIGYVVKPYTAPPQRQPQTLDEALQQPRAMAQAYENGYKAGVAAERERCLRLIDDHVRAVDSEDVVRAIKEVQG